MADATTTGGAVDIERPSERYGRYALAIFVLVFTLNMIDRQILSILAEDVKRDLGLSDAELGFLYGTAFAIFYSLFGIPLGRLADGWQRVRLLTIGLAVWSGMTALSGLARNGIQLAVARIGVGVGEATCSPCAYSLLSDYFAREKRATVLAIYASGGTLGAGLAFALGGAIVTAWNQAFPGGGPLGLVGWQAAFLAVGVPGVLLSFVVATLREPVRGAAEGIATPASPSPFADFLQELVAVIPPFTLIGAMQRGPQALAINLGVAAGLASLAWWLAAAMGNAPQWIAVAIGVYAVFSWATSLRARDYPTFKLIWGTPAFLQVTIAYGLLLFISYSANFWGAPYAERVLGESKAVIGAWVGGGSVAGGFIGVILGGRLADRLRRSNPSGRILVMLGGTVGMILPVVIAFTTAHPQVFYIMYALMSVLISGTLGAAAATTQDLVLPRMRGTATATFMLSQAMLGLALGPYMAGYISGVTGSLRAGVLSVLVAAPVCVVLLLLAYRGLPRAEASTIERARAAGEPAGG